jgi:acyl carrier protein
MTDIAASADDIRRVLIGAIGRETGVTPDELPVQHTFTELGVDSVTALIVAMDLEEAFDLADLPSTLLWRYPTIAALTPALLDLLRDRPATARNGEQRCENQ